MLKSKKILVYKLFSDGNLIGLTFIFFSGFLLFSIQGVCQLSVTKSGSSVSSISIAGSSSQWTNLSNIFSSDNIYTTLTSNLSSSGNYSDYLQVTNFNFSIPTGSIVNGILVTIERSDANGKTKDRYVKIVKSGIIGSTDKSKNPAWGSSDLGTGYGSASDLWGQSFSVSDINATNFGIVFAVQRTGGGPQTTLAKIDHISITVYYGVLLPIQLIYFNASATENYAQLTWSTASEINNDYFTIQRSEDGIQFADLKTINGAGTSLVENSYSFIDEKPKNGVTYYRLKQTDFDGNNTFSEIKSIIRVEYFEANFFPNPFQNNLKLKYQCKQSENIEIVIYNIVGEKLFKTQTITHTGLNFIELNNLYFPEGTYIISIYENQQLKMNSTLVHII